VVVGAGDEHECIEHFRGWLSSAMSGCRFAAVFAAKASTKRIAYYARIGRLAAGDIASVDEVIATAGMHDRFVVLLFPHVRSVREIGILLETLDKGSRWRCSHVPWAKHERTWDDLVSVEWRTDEGRWSSAMGFAPAGEMPATRRSPYVALAMWPGVIRNHFRPGQAGPDAIGLVDGKHGLRRNVHDTMWSNTSARVRALLADPPEDRVYLRHVAFCLPRTVARTLDFKDKSKAQ
jgi:hypothetical protein